MNDMINQIPENIKDKIIFDSIILLKISYGWKNVHKQIINYKKKSIIDIFSMDEHGNYLDDICEISYW
tara:strand:- start:23882 stop:24085 length:204 start_codon:yes stop_codon:yes gene_type:complete